MCTLLIVFLLAAGSADAVPGSQSVQYCSSERATWRIRTHAGSAEITQAAMTPSDVEALAEAEMRAEFGVSIQRKLTIVGADDSGALLTALQRHGLRGRVVTDDARRLAYWQAAASR